MEGLQTNHHMPCELDIDGKPLALRSISIGYHFLHLCSRKKNPQLYAQAISSSHSPKYKALFFLNISLKLKLTADTLL